MAEELQTVGIFRHEKLLHSSTKLEGAPDKRFDPARHLFGSKQSMVAIKPVLGALDGVTIQST